MRKLFLWVLFVMTLVIPFQTTAAATTVSDVRWVTRNDAAISYVRMVLELSNPVNADATISKDGLTTQIVLKNATMPNAPMRLVMNPKIAGSAIFAETGSNVMITIETPTAIDTSDLHIFSLKKGLQPNKPERLVIDIKQKNVAPRQDYYGKPPAPKPKNSRVPYSETGPYRVGGGLAGKIIVIDPGHGGTDPGSISSDGIMEKNITLPISLKLRDLLTTGGAKVILTRTTDRDVYGPHASAVDELQARADVGNNNRADMFISIHINAFTNPNVGGIADYYYVKTPYDKKLATTIQRHISRQPNMGPDRGTNEAGLYVLNHTLMPATLVELGFISNPSEVAQLKTDKVQQEFAQLLYDGIVEYFKG